MTAQESERLAKVETKLEGIKDDIAEIKQILKKQDKTFNIHADTIHSRIDKLDRRFVLRREAIAVVGTVSFILAVVGSVVAIIASKVL